MIISRWEISPTTTAIGRRTWGGMGEIWARKGEIWGRYGEICHDHGKAHRCEARKAGGPSAADAQRAEAHRHAHDGRAGEVLHLLGLGLG